MKEEKDKRIVSWIEGKPIGPWSLQIQVSNKCNLKCRFCCRNFEEIGDDMISDDRLLEIIDEAAELGVGRIALNGRAGEPMMRKKILLKMMEKIKQYGIWGDLITNGTLYEESNIEKIVRMGWDNIVFSLDGPTANIHNQLRGRDYTFDKLIESIKTINRFKKELGKEKPEVKILMVLTSLSCDKVHEMVSLAKELSIDTVEVRPMIVHDQSGGALKDLEIKPGDIPRMIESISKAKEKSNESGVRLLLEYDIDDMINYFERNGNENSPRKNIDHENREIREANERISDLKCLFPFFELTIFPEGTAAPCCVLFKNEGGKMIVDNMIEKSLKDVWFGNCFTNYRKKVLSGELPEWCSTCQM